MGMAICGMHYTGMSAAIFTSYASHTMPCENAIILPNYLAFYISGVVLLIFAIALTASRYYKKMIIAVENEKEFLNAMLDNMEDGIIACHAEWRITVLNHAIQRHINSDKVNKDINNILDYFSLFTMNHTPISK